MKEECNNLKLITMTLAAYYNHKAMKNKDTIKIQSYV